jgi:hypothetical protein
MGFRHRQEQIGSPNLGGIFFQGALKKEREPKKRSLNKKYRPPFQQIWGVLTKKRSNSRGPMGQSTPGHREQISLGTLQMNFGVMHTEFEFE